MIAPLPFIHVAKLEPFAPWIFTLKLCRPSDTFIVGASLICSDNNLNFGFICSFSPCYRHHPPSFGAFSFPSAICLEFSPEPKHLHFGRKSRMFRDFINYVWSVRGGTTLVFYQEKMKALCPNIRDGSSTCFLLQHSRMGYDCECGLWPTIWL